MKHLEPQPRRLPSQTPPQPPAKMPVGKVTLAALFLGMTLGIGSLLTAIWGVPSADNLSDSEKATLISEFARAQPLKLTAVAADEMDSALDMMQLDPQQRSALQSALDNPPAEDSKKSSLGWIELWDFAHQDGDVVRISSAGYELVYPLQNAPTRLAVPLDASATIQVEGVTDGGGGITLGLRSGATAISLPVIQPGQTLIVPATF